MQPALFKAGPYVACELATPDLPALQDFFVANPEYFLAVNGMPPRPDEAKLEYEDRPPAGMPYERIYVIGFLSEAGAIAGMASVLSNLLAPRVWHVGLFIVAGSLHGTGTARLLYDALEQWAARGGASWMRLGVVAGNAKAERFWEKQGFREVRRRAGGQPGGVAQTVRVMVKPLVPSGLDGYLRLVARDRPEDLAPGGAPVMPRSAPVRTIATPALTLEPQLAAHAPEMFDVLSDPALFQYENQPPPSLDWLRDRFARLESRQSPDGREIWLNWVIRLPSGELIGYVQATVHASGRAAIAYVLASRYWGRGLATRAVEAMLQELAQQYRVDALSAVLKRGNARSLRLLERLGFTLATPDRHAALQAQSDEILMIRGWPRV